MTFFTSQERLVIRFLVVSMFIGLLIGIVRQKIILNDNRIDAVGSSLLSLDLKKSDSRTEKLELDQKQGVLENPIELSAEIININTATKEELLTLPKIGPVTAERIIRFREDFGQFQSLEDILKVKGIGPKTFDRIKPFITI